MRRYGALRHASQCVSRFDEGDHVQLRDAVAHQSRGRRRQRDGLRVRRFRYWNFIDRRRPRDDARRAAGRIVDRIFPGRDEVHFGGARHV